MIDYPVGGGVCYYGSTDTDASDFDTGIRLLAGDSGNIESRYQNANYTLRYNWMTTNKFILSGSAATTSSAWGFSIFVSSTGDVFAVMGPGLAVSSPIYTTNYSTSYSWAYEGADYGISSGSPIIVMCKMKVVDVCGENSSYVYGVSSGSQVMDLYPDVMAKTKGDNSGKRLPNPTYSTSKFAVLGPIYNNMSSGITTYARFVHSSPSGGLSAGAYTIGGFKYRILSPHSSLIAFRGE